MLNDIFLYNLSAASIFILFISIFIVFSCKKQADGTSDSVSLSIFFCILFTAGLDIGLIMFPMMEFDKYSNPEYYGINPLSLEIGFWGGIVWVFYFISTFYFVYIEPRLKLFESSKMKLTFSLLMLLTCAFSAKLFVDFFIFYLPPFIYSKYTNVFTHENIVIITVSILTLSAISALSISLIKILSYISLILFSALIVFGLFIVTDIFSFKQYIGTLLIGVSGYLENILLFIKPMNSYHEFYMFWWFSWSLMIGKFISRFVPKGITPSQLFLFMIIIPTIPLSIWFSICYSLYISNASIGSSFLVLMALVGLLFIINSFDSAIRVSANLISESVKTIKYKTSLLISYFLLVLFFISYSGFYNGTDGFIKIEYTGTLAILVIYYVVYKVITTYIYERTSIYKRRKNKGEFS